MEKVLLFCDPGIDDSVAIMYALLHPGLDVVGIVTGYGNVTQEQATANAFYLLSLAGRSDIPVYAGAQFPLTGEIATYYPEIHGENGLGPIRPPIDLEGELLNFTDLFDLIISYPDDITIIDVGRLTSLSIAYILGEETMGRVKQVIVMGGAFFVPGNVSPVAEANFIGDPVAANLIMERARPLTVVPLNVTSYSVVTDEHIRAITDRYYNPFTPFIQPIYHYYATAYSALIPGLEGALFHDVLAVMALVHPEMFQMMKRDVSVSIAPLTRGQSVADFRPFAPEGELKIAVDFHYPTFIQSFIQVLRREL
ncbi:nucleoside hydrolase [Halalkalibacterium halodurans]|uniref:Nucleoside hydrolase n=1 Tax=Halalkalibacterium halodurans TaxID=86665 RepID=A0A0M0KDJ3_ALKHA|nr:nucleoside hydrolase [Halalkalibacterium halodurans]TPE67529.1 nucleoside hydrolase [Halalkalibacterium halodurans]